MDNHFSCTSNFGHFKFVLTYFSIFECHLIQEIYLGKLFLIMFPGLPIIYILVVVPRLMPWEISVFLSWCHIAGSVSPWIGSFLYHLFMNLHLGEDCYYRLLQLDMLGIWISQSFGKLPIIMMGVPKQSLTSHHLNC